MRTPERIQIAGWFVGAVLGVLGTLLVIHLTARRRVVEWEVLNESTLTVDDVSKRLQMPVAISVGDERTQQVSTVTVEIRNAGNDVISDLSLAVEFGESSRLLGGPSIQEFGEFGRHVKFSHVEDTARMDFAYLNPGQSIKPTWTLADYAKGACRVDGAGVGLTIRPVAPPRTPIVLTLSAVITFAMATLAIAMMVVDGFRSRRFLAKLAAFQKEVLPRIANLKYLEELVAKIAQREGWIERQSEAPDDVSDKAPTFAVGHTQETSP